MKPEEVHHIGFLTNVDSSILNIKLDNGFEIKRIQKERAVSLASILDNTTQRATSTNFNSNIINYEPFTNGKRYLYYIYYSYFPDNNDSTEFYKKWHYTRNVISLLRLFKEGDVDIAIEYEFYYKNGVPLPRSGAQATRHLSRNLYTLKEYEIAKLQKFILKTNLPFKKDFLQLSFENFMLSYETPPIKLQFLTLMNGMEVLFHPPHEGKLRYTISRNVAALLGKDKEDSKLIRTEIKKFYDKRSDIVHRGKANINYNDVLKLRQYARESMKKIYRMNKSRNELLELLNSNGSGE